MAELTFHRSVRTYGVHPFNPLKLLAHADRVKAMLDGQPIFPVSVELDLSLRCNHGCAWCSFDGWRQANWISFPEARALTLIDELAECGVLSVTLTGGGEPLVHQGAARVMDRLTARGLEWGLVTNGFMLTNERADRVARHARFVRVSLDAGTEETHQRIHATQNREFRQIIGNIGVVAREAQALGTGVTIGASFCVFDSNLREITQAARTLKDLGAHYLEVRPVYPTEWRGGRQDDQGISPENIAVAQAEIECARALCEDASFKIIGMIDRFEAVQSFRHKEFYSACRITDLSTVISSDGQIYACCVHRGLEPFKGGSVLERPFREVWLSEARTAMRDAIDIDRCPKCRYVGLNAVIDGAVRSDGMHRNFI